MRRDPKKPQIIFWIINFWWVPCGTGFPHCVSVLGTHLALLWEAAFGFSELFLKSLSVYLPVSWWVIYKCTCAHRAEGSAVFDQKEHDPHAPPSLFTQSHPQWLCCCFPRWKTSSKRNILPSVEEVKQKTAEALKGVKIDKFKNCFFYFLKINLLFNYSCQKLFWAVGKMSW